MSKLTGGLALARSLLTNPQIVLAKPAVNWFLLQYLRKFTPTRAGDHLVLHSHLPPVNSRAYARFINEHLLNRNSGPSHAQIGLTNVCPHHCDYCYNRGRSGEVMDTATVLKVIRGLKAMGVFWLGFTGGEPLLRKDLVRITESAAEGCAVKIFTTGATLTREMAADLQRAGLFSVSVSLDRELAEQALQDEQRSPEVRARLYRNACLLGEQARRQLRVRNLHEVMAAGQVLYRVLGIEFCPTADGALEIPRCFFSRYYTSGVCRLISALDEGVVAGLSQGARLVFEQRLTEGCSCCKARLVWRGATDEAARGCGG